jgi:hypothetical protein
LEQMQYIFKHLKAIDFCWVWINNQENIIYFKTLVAISGSNI